MLHSGHHCVVYGSKPVTDNSISCVLFKLQLVD